MHKLPIHRCQSPYSDNLARHLSKAVVRQRLCGRPSQIPKHDPPCGKCQSKATKPDFDANKSRLPLSHHLPAQQYAVILARLCALRFFSQVANGKPANVQSTGNAALRDTLGQCGFNCRLFRCAHSATARFQGKGFATGFTTPPWRPVAIVTEANHIRRLTMRTREGYHTHSISAML